MPLGQRGIVIRPMTGRRSVAVKRACPSIAGAVAGGSLVPLKWRLQGLRLDHYSMTAH